MDPFTPLVKEALDTFIARVREDLPVVAVYVFGSVARGEARGGSDIDVAVVSPRFRTMRRVDAISFLLDKTRGIGVDLQPVGLTPEDLDDGDDVVAQAIAADGIEVMAA